MSNKCKHNRIKRKMILDGKREGTYKAYCTQQCKKMREITITTEDVRNILPNYKKDK